MRSHIATYELSLRRRYVDWDTAGLAITERCQRDRSDSKLLILDRNRRSCTKTNKHRARSPRYRYRH